MIFNHKYRIGFIHIPRCAGTTLTRSLMDEEGTRLIWTAVGNKHWSWQSTLSQTLDFDPNTYTLVATHRNPYERLVSLWAHNNDILRRKLNPEQSQHKRIQFKGKTIEQYQELLKQRETFEQYVQNCAEGKDKPFAPQTELIKGAPDHLQLFPHTEVQKAIQYLSDQTGCEVRKTKLQNTSPLARSTSHTDFTRAWCRKYYQSDFEQLGYSF